MLQEGSTVGGIYQIMNEIGRGGTGVVYLGWHLNLQKYVVLKRITIDIRDMDALRREADILKNLRHTNLPQIYDFVIENGEVFTVMDYVEGESLDRYISGGNRLSEELLTGWLLTLSDVLVYLQSRKHPVIHSDIKPGNIIITPQGDPVLIDFNISIDMAAPGKLAGYSMYYASPEQVYMAEEIKAGRQPGYSLDARTDIYSLGVVFYSLITGETPDSRYLIPRLATTEGLRYSQAFLSVLDKCTEWDRNDRFRTPKKLASAVKNLYRMDRTYRRYAAMRAAGWIASAVIFSSGCLCMLQGAQLNSRHKAEELYSEVAAEMQISNYTAAAEAADDLLDRWDCSRQLSKEQRGELLHVIGDADYINGNYSDAADCYRKAADLFTENREMKERSLADLAVALLAAGEGADIEDLRSEARSEGVDAAVIDLAEAAAYSRAGDSANCLKYTEAVLSGSGSDSIKADACLIGARCCSSIMDSIKYLRMATDYSQDAKYIRERAMAEYNCAGSGVGGSVYAENAAALFEKLCRSPRSSATDRMNLGISYYLAGRYQECIDRLSSLTGTDNYKVDMYLALACEKTGDKNRASIYCSDAIYKCRKSQSSEAASDLEVMEDLASRL